MTEQLVIGAMNATTAFVVLVIALKERIWVLVAAATLLLTLALETMVNAQTWTEVDVLGNSGQRSLSANTITLTESQPPPLGLGYADSITMTLAGSSLDGCSQVDLDVWCSLQQDNAINPADTECVAGAWIFQLLGTSGSKAGGAHFTFTPPYSDFTAQVTLFGHLSGSSALTLTLNGTGCQLNGLSGNSVHHQRMTDKAKASLRRQQVAFGSIGLAFSGAALACAPVECKAGFGILALGAGAVSMSIQSALNVDPYDGNYWQVPQVVLPSKPSNTPPAARPLMRNHRWLQGLNDALYTAINRANSAQDDGVPAAEALQQSAINSLVQQIKSRMALEGPDLAALTVQWPEASPALAAWKNK